MGGLPVHESCMPLSTSKEPRSIKALLCTAPALPPWNLPLGSRAPGGNVFFLLGQLLLSYLGIAIFFFNNLSKSRLKFLPALKYLETCLNI